MTEQNVIELLKMWSSWFSQIITLSTGLILILIAFHEKVFVNRPSKPLQTLLIFGMMASFGGFLFAIWWSVGGQLHLLGIVPGSSSDPSNVQAYLSDSTTKAVIGFAVGMGFLILYSLANILLGSFRHGESAMEPQKEQASE